MVPPPDNTTLANSLADLNVTLHDVVKRRVVEFVGSSFHQRGTPRASHTTQDFQLFANERQWKVLVNSPEEHHSGRGEW